jgi:hypothetical protein
MWRSVGVQTQIMYCFKMIHSGHFLTDPYTLTGSW